MQYQAAWWSLELADGWNHQDGGAEDVAPDGVGGEADFAKADGVGTLRVIFGESFRDVTQEDLRGFACFPEMSARSIGDLTGFFDSGVEDDTFYMQWCLACGPLFITPQYSCPVSDREREAADVIAMVESLRVLPRG